MSGVQGRGAQGVSGRSVQGYGVQGFGSQGSQPSFAINFASAQSLVPEIGGVQPTFTRASTGAVFGSNGLLQFASANQPRFEYDPIALTCRGLLMEETRTNLALYSQQIGTGPFWGNNGFVTWTANNAVAPDGTTTAARAVTTSGDGSYRTGATGEFPMVSGTSYTISGFYAYGSGNNVASVGCDSNVAGGVAMLGFNSQTGAFLSAGPGVTSYSITMLPNGWIRWTVSFVSASTSATLGSLVIYNSAAGTFYAWGTQWETGTSPTSYIPTVAAAVTRAADALSYPSAGWFAPANGTFVEDYTPGISPFGAMSMSPVLVGQYMGLGSGNQTGWFASGIASGSVSPGVRTKQAVAYDNAGNFAGSRDGGAVATSAASDFLGTSTALNVGFANTTPLNGVIRALTYYPTKIPNAQLQQLSA